MSHSGRKWSIARDESNVEYDGDTILITGKPSSEELNALAEYVRGLDGGVSLSMGENGEETETVSLHAGISGETAVNGEDYAGDGRSRTVVTEE